MEDKSTQSECDGQIMVEETGKTLQVLHKELIDGVKAKGYISSRRVEAAFRSIPRHLFLPGVAPQEVYQDRAIITKTVGGRFVSSSSQPTMMAIMLEQLELHAGHRVLEIGAGTGYNAALMAHIVGETGHVVSIDIDEDIVGAARTHLKLAGYERVQVVCADGGLGFPDAAPFDRIILTVNAGDIAPAWREQLAPDGRLLLPFTVRGPQVAIAFKQVETHLESVSVQPCGFVGLRGAFAEQGRFLQLDAEQGIAFLTLGEQQTIAAETVRGWLNKPAQDHSAQVRATLPELFGSLQLWLAVHEPRFCSFTLQRTAIERNIVPSLFPELGDIPAYTVAGLLSEQGLSVILYSVEQAVGVDLNTTLLPLPLTIRTFGDDPELPHQLSMLLDAWQQAGHPREQRLRVRAYPREHQLPPSPQDMIHERKWTRFLFNYK